MYLDFKCDIKTFKIEILKQITVSASERGVNVYLHFTPNQRLGKMPEVQNIYFYFFERGLEVSLLPISSSIFSLL